jgi:hypothetical protein
MNIFHLQRGRVHVTCCDGPDQGATFTDRVKPDFNADYRLLVKGCSWTPGFGLVYTDADSWRNDGPGMPRLFGASLSAYGVAGVIDNYGGTGAEIERERRESRLIEAEEGDLLVMPDPSARVLFTAWRIEILRREHIKLIDVTDEQFAFVIDELAKR